mmetsp:Transcript_5050/g.17525  ORF Transcript_5050/g.17525 Transcript_5050/m.17525 type:complete len:396 (+) Transcript_5050:82-1269(+)
MVEFCSYPMSNRCVMKTCRCVSARALSLSLLYLSGFSGGDGCGFVEAVVFGARQVLPLLDDLEVLVDGREGVGGDGSGGGHRGHANPWEDGVAAPEESVDGGEDAGHGGAGELVGVEAWEDGGLSGGQPRPVRALAPPEEELVRERARGFDKDDAVVNVGDHSADAFPEELRALLLHFEVPLTLAVLFVVEAFPELKGFGGGAVDVEEVVSLGRHLGVEDGGDEDGDGVLRRRERLVPIVNDDARGVGEVLEPVRLDPDEEVDEAAHVLGFGILVEPALRPRRELVALEHLVGVPHGGARHHRLGGSDPPLLAFDGGHHPNRAPVPHHNLVDVVREAQLPVVLLERLDERVHHRLGATNRGAQERPGFMKVRDAVHHRRRHATLRREARQERQAP